MNSVHTLAINSKDLNLLPIFYALMLERSVSKVAKRLSLTQSAVSHALGRLRRELGDDLLVRAPQGMVPTPFALALMPRVAPLMAALTAVYQMDSAFDPGRSEAVFRVATTDFIEATLMQDFLPRLRREAPGITVVTRPALGVLPKQELENGGIDIAVAGFFGTLPEGFYQRKCFTDTYLSAVRRGHPALQGGGMTLATFAGLEHVMASPQGDLLGAVDLELKKKKLRRRVVAGTFSFHAPPWLVVESDLVVTAPARLLHAYARYFPLQLFQPPLKLPSIHVVQVWHERTHRSALHRWLRTAFEEAAATSAVAT